MREIRILVLGVGGNVSLGILKAINNSNLNCYVIGACVESDAVGLYLCDKSYLSPYANTDDFMLWLVSVCKKEKVDIVLTGVEEVILSIAKNIEYFKKNTNSCFVSAEYEKLLIGQDKLLTCEWLKENECNYPEYCSASGEEVKKFIDKVKLPIIAKPRDGKGSNGIIKIEKYNELSLLEGKNNYVFQRYLGSEDDEYTVGCYCNKNSELVDLIIINRTLKSGNTQKAIIMENEIIRKEAEKICAKLKIVGPLNIQMRIDKGRAVCFELNIRFSGTTPIRAHYGFNDVEALIREYILNEDISKIFKVKTGVALRYTNEIYLTEEMYEKMKCIKQGKSVNCSDVKIDMLGV